MGSGFFPNIEPLCQQVLAAAAETDSDLKNLEVAKKRRRKRNESYPPLSDRLCSKPRLKLWQVIICDYQYQKISEKRRRSHPKTPSDRVFIFPRWSIPGHLSRPDLKKCRSVTGEMVVEKNSPVRLERVARLQFCSEPFNDECRMEIKLFPCQNHESGH